MHLTLCNLALSRVYALVRTSALEETVGVFVIINALSANLRGLLLYPSESSQFTSDLPTTSALLRDGKI